jgi:hypothetical protein
VGVLVPVRASVTRGRRDVPCTGRLILAFIVVALLAALASQCQSSDCTLQK